MKYKCVKEFKIPMFDEYGSLTNDYHTVHVGSVYEYEADYVGNSDVRMYLENSDVRMYLENGNSDFDWIDITFEIFDEHFERIG